MAILSEILLLALLSEVSNDTVDWRSKVSHTSFYCSQLKDNHGGDGRRTSKSEFL